MQGGGGSVLSHVRMWKVHKECELRLEAKEDARLFVTLQHGDGSTAEIFGTELAPRRKYEVYRGRCAVFTWTGCEVQQTRAALGHARSLLMAAACRLKWRASVTPTWRRKRQCCRT